MHLEYRSYLIQYKLGRIRILPKMIFCKIQFSGFYRGLHDRLGHEPRQPYPEFPWAVAR